MASETDEPSPAGSIGAMYCQLRPHMVAYAAALLQCQDAAEDAVQCTIAASIRAVLHHPREVSEAYLFVALRHECLRERRRRSLQRRMGNEEQAEVWFAISADEHESSPREKQLDWLYGAIDDLPPATRAVVEARLEGCSYQQIASELGVAVNTVNAHVQRARKMLREMLERERERAAVRRGALAECFGIDAYGRPGIPGASEFMRRRFRSAR